MVRSFFSGCIAFSVSLLVSGCYPINTTTNYDKAWTTKSSYSEPIHLSFKDSKHSPYYFLLRNDYSAGTYQLVVRWNSPDSDVLFNGTKSTLKFLIDDSEVLSFAPIKQTTIVSYNLDTKGHQEEAIFIVPYDDLHKIAYAKRVKTELTGKYAVVMGKFNKFHTFKAFRNFINAS
jgi:hypothetical protein